MRTGEQDRAILHRQALDILRSRSAHREDVAACTKPFFERFPIGQVELLIGTRGEIAPRIKRNAVVVLGPQRIRVRSLPISPL